MYNERKTHALSILSKVLEQLKILYFIIKVTRLCTLAPSKTEGQLSICQKVNLFFMDNYSLDIISKVKIGLLDHYSMMKSDVLFVISNIIK